MLFNQERRCYFAKAEENLSIMIVEIQVAVDYVIWFS